MQAIWNVVAVAGLAVLCGCGGLLDSAGGPELPEGKPVVTPEFESYPTAGTGQNRVRRDRSTLADAAVIAQFEDANPADPAGYRNLIALSDEAYEGRVTIEVIAEVDGSGGTERVTRILRLTADHAPFENVRNGELVAATGKYFLRGQNFVWVSIDGQPLLSGSDSNGLVNMELDFDAETASLDLRTGVTGASEVRTAIQAEGLPFNIVTGAYGGDITIQVWDPDSSAIFAIDGSLRGNVGGTPDFANGTHGMTTSGLYTATGADGETQLVIDGVFVGTDPNALP